MISTKEFSALIKTDKIELLQNILKDSYTHSPVLGKMYAHITSELPKDDVLLDQMYAGISESQKDKNQQDVQKHVDDVKKLQKQGSEEFDQKHFDDLLTKI